MQGHITVTGVCPHFIVIGIAEGGHWKYMVPAGMLPSV